MSGWIPKPGDVVAVRARVEADHHGDFWLRYPKTASRFHEYPRVVAPWMSRERQKALQALAAGVKRAHQRNYRGDAPSEISTLLQRLQETQP